MEGTRWLVEYIQEHPVLSSAVAGLLTTAASFMRPVAEAARAALIRRLDRAWDEDGGDDDEKERRVVAKLNRTTLLPRGVVEAEVRKKRDRER